MGFLEKVKNMFIEEVEDEEEVKVEKVTKDISSSSLDTLSQPKDELNFHFDDNLEEESKPIFFDDNAFSDLDNNEVKKIKQEEVFDNVIENSELNNISDNSYIDEYVENNKIYEDRNLYDYNKNYSKLEENKEVLEKKCFKPTPIISPVYGILDKNYHKEDIISKNDYKEEIEVEPSIDQVRNKAYGTLEDELENTLFGKNSILFNNENSSNIEEIDELNTDDLSSLTDDISKELDELLSKKEKYSEKELKSRVKKNSTLNEDDLLEFIDSTLYKDGDEE